jgi:hypothetical protein
MPGLTQREVDVDASRQLRKSLDEIMQLLVLLPQSSEREQAKLNITIAKMWLGADLKRLDAVAPELDAPRAPGDQPAVVEAAP